MLLALRSLWEGGAPAPSAQRINAPPRRRPTNPTRARSHLVAATPTTAVPPTAGYPIVTAGRKRLPPRHSSYLYFYQPPPQVGPPALAEPITGAARRAVNRARSRLVQAPLYNSGGLSPELSSGIRRLNLSRPASHLQLAPVYNSGGRVPELLAAVQKRLPLRARSHQLPAPLYNSGGFTPEQVSGIRRRNPTRAVSRPEPAAAYNSGGLTSRQISGWRRLIPLRARSRVELVIVGIAAAVGVKPALTNGVPRRPQRTQAVSRWLLAVPGVAAAAGTPPKLTVGTKRKAPQRSNSRSRRAAAYNSGGLVPPVTSGLKRRNLNRAGSRLELAVLYNSGGFLPKVISSLRRTTPIRTRPPRLVLPPVVVVAPAALPELVSGLRRPAPTRTRFPRLFRPLAVVVAAARPQFTIATQKPRSQRSGSRWLGALSGPAQVAAGSPPQLTAAARRRPPLRASSHRLLLAPVNPTSLKPAQGSRRSNRHRPGSRWLVSPRYNSGGLAPELTSGVRRPAAKVKPSHRQVAASYNSGGIRPLFKSVPRQKPPTRGRSYTWLLPVPELATKLRYYVDDPEPKRILSSGETQTALLDQEPAVGLISSEPTAGLTDTEPPPGSTRVRGQ